MELEMYKKTVFQSKEIVYLKRKKDRSQVDSKKSKNQD